MRVGLIVSLAWIPTGMLYPIVDNANLAAALLIPSAFLTSAPFGVSAAAIQQMMPNYMRGQASAIYLFVVNLLGLGIGPWLVAFFTDYVFRGDDSVRYSLLIVCDGGAPDLRRVAVDRPQIFSPKPGLFERMDEGSRLI